MSIRQAIGLPYRVNEGIELLVSHHAAISTAAAVLAAPLVRSKWSLLLFVGAAVGLDVDHYLWYAIKFRNPDLRDAYRYFRSRYGRLPQRPAKRISRAFHGQPALSLVLGLAIVDRRVLPIALGVAFHDALDDFNERVLVPKRSTRVVGIDPPRTIEQVSTAGRKN